MYLLNGGFILMMLFAVIGADLPNFLISYTIGFILTISIASYILFTNYKRGNDNINVKLYYDTLDEAEKYIDMISNINKNGIDGVLVKKILVEIKKED